MPGRQAHGRPLIAAPKAKAAAKRSKARSEKTALDAFGIAQRQFPTQHKKTPRARELDADIDIEHRHGREDGDHQRDHVQDETTPVKKKTQGLSSRPTDDVDYGSDSEGNEWRLGGLADDDDDSEIESDDAFGESDDDKFQGYSFRGSKSQRTGDDSEDDSQDDDGGTLGAEAIDLATALDQFEDGSSEPEHDDAQAQGSDDDEADESSSENDDDEDEEQEVDPDRLKVLQDLVSGYAGDEQGKDDQNRSISSNKISLGDLDLSGVSDPLMNKSVKLLRREEKEKRPGASKKLDVPLAKRQQDRLDRAAAYEKTNETLNRWTETVKQNRRAEHLIFPLPQNSETAGLDTTEIQPLTQKAACTELETAVMSIMEQSGLSLEKKPKPKPHEVDEEGNVLSRKQALQRKRKERELIDREAKRAKRIKKIKSKAYHRVHRKEKERLEMAEKAAMEEAGEIDSEEEREVQDRRRALERVGLRHKDSKWAKVGSKAKRAVWDDDFRTGLADMARKDEELRRRKAGKRGDVDDSDETSSSDSDSHDELSRLKRELDELNRGNESKLMGLKFMQKAEAAQKAANENVIKQMQRQLDGDEDVSSEDEADEVGRRSYGSTMAGSMRPMALDLTKQAVKRLRSKGGGADETGAARLSRHSGREAETGPVISLAPTPAPTNGPWSQDKARRRRKGGGASGRGEELDVAAANAAVEAPRPKILDDSESEWELHLPLAIQDEQMVERAFAGDDVVAEFEREKQAVQEADDDKVLDSTLPGWGSWVGEGVSERERRRHTGRFLTRIEGVKVEARKDAKLERVIINERHVKKNDRFRASQLPHPYESRHQYESALRLPVGPEWMTKQTFQEGIKPRVLAKQGVITPMSKPTA
ncbi:hypothetical protein CDD81_432 [Ophiocordyceps australis]|uniref:Uncharacterized protein n=1 Tax=Ophiocordyceps australis TaxID=1399860 RepID=A0A2C5Y320_9HYPO|nr:hypothetical protein CDD81_432 [Ophiocordyceps australis]